MVQQDLTQPQVSHLFTDQGPEKRAGERESVPNLPSVPRPHHLAIAGQESRKEEQEEHKKVRFQSNNQLEGRTSLFALVFVSTPGRNLQERSGPRYRGLV